MIGCVIDSLLNSTRSLNILSMVCWPKPSKVLSVNLDDFNVRIGFLDFVENMVKMVVNLGDKVLGVQEALSEIVPWLFAWNGYLLRQEISPSTIPSNLIPTIIVN